MNVLVPYPAAERFVVPVPEDPSTRWAPDDNEKIKCSQRPFTQTFHLSVQREVGLLFQNWWFLPDPTSFEPAVDALRPVAHDLDAQGAFVAPSTDPKKGPETTQLSDGAWRSTTTSVSSSATSLSGQQVAAAVMGTLVTGEQQIWEPGPAGRGDELPAGRGGVQRDR